LPRLLTGAALETVQHYRFERSLYLVAWGVAAGAQTCVTKVLVT
jgi:hypothetical protein